MAALVSPTDMTSTVPRGSILGPSLVLLYINDLPNYLRINTILYTGDTNIFIEANSVMDLYIKGNYTLIRLQAWLA